MCGGQAGGRVAHLTITYFWRGLLPKSELCLNQQCALARRPRVVHDYYSLRLFACKDQGNNPANKRNSKQDIDDDSGRLVRAVSSDGRDSGQEIYV